MAVASDAKTETDCEAPSLRDHAVRLVCSDPERSWTTREIAERLVGVGVLSDVRAELATLRTVLARAAAAGQIRRIGPGAFRADSRPRGAGGLEAAKPTYFGLRRALLRAISSDPDRVWSRAELRRFLTESGGFAQSARFPVALREALAEAVDRQELRRLGRDAFCARGHGPEPEPTGPSKTALSVREEIVSLVCSHPERSWSKQELFEHLLTAGRLEDSDSGRFSLTSAVATATNKGEITRVRRGFFRAPGADGPDAAAGERLMSSSRPSPSVGVKALRVVASEPRRSWTRQEILRRLMAQGELADTRPARKALSAALCRAVERGELTRLERGRYRPAGHFPEI